MKANPLISTTFAVFAALAFTACHYDFPAAGPNHVQIDPLLAGRWISAPVPKGKETRKALVIAPSRLGGAFVDLEADDGVHWYFRAWPLPNELPGLYQLEWLGTSEGKAPEEKPFTIVSVSVGDDLLEWRTIDPGKVGEVKDANQLIQRLKDAARKHEDLFSKRSLYTPTR